MDNLSRFLSEIAAALDDLVGALADSGPGVYEWTKTSLRDYAGQMRAVADAADGDRIDWERIDAEIGTEVEPEPRPLIHIVLGPREVDELILDVDVPPQTAIARAVRWAPAIQRAATELCSSQLRSVMEIDTP